jgi:RNA polymerase sigma factor for flagellar operon FliA
MNGMTITDRPRSQRSQRTQIKTQPRRAAAPSKPALGKARRWTLPAQDSGNPADHSNSKTIMTTSLLSADMSVRDRRSQNKDLWRSYSRKSAGPGSSTENELVKEYLPLVKSIVGRLAMTLPPHVSSEDLYSSGLVGLLNALRRYNPKSGTSFETYARVRIRGAIVDELRRLDWVPRSVHDKARQVEKVMRQLEQTKGKAVTDVEMAKALKMKLEEYHQLLDEIKPATFVCLDAVRMHENEEGSSRYESMPDDRCLRPDEGVEWRETAEIISDHINQLPQMQRQVLALYYYEDLRLREIAEVFGVTESRICQIHAQAILSIRGKLQSQRESLPSIVH